MRQWVLVAVLVVGCSEPQPGTELVVRDSAGVQILERPGSAWDAPTTWGVSTDPIVVIDDEFHEVASALRLPSGRIAVADRGTNVVGVYESDGTRVYRLGGSGSGPGEFAALQGLGRLEGDSLFAFDRRLGRITLFDATGSLLGTVQTQGTLVSVSRFVDGRWFVAEAEGEWGTTLDPSAPAGLHRSPAAAFVLDRDGVQMDTVGNFPASEMAITRVDGRPGAVPPPYGRMLSFALEGELIYVGTGDFLGFDVYSPDGRKLRSVRAPEPDRTLTTVDVELFQAAMLDALPSGVDASAFEAILREATVPREKAAYTRLLVDPRGKVWLSEYESSFLATGLWRVVDGEGNPVAEVRVPDGFRITDLGVDHVLGVWRGDFDVESIRMYQLERR